MTSRKFSASAHRFRTRMETLNNNRRQAVFIDPPPGRGRTRLRLRGRNEERCLTRQRAQHQHVPQQRVEDVGRWERAHRDSHPHDSAAEGVVHKYLALHVPEGERASPTPVRSEQGPIIEYPPSPTGSSRDEETVNHSAFVGHVGSPFPTTILSLTTTPPVGFRGQVPITTLARFGVPKLLISDNGTQFTSRSFTRILEQWGVKHQLTAPYTPQENAVERANRVVKTIIAPCCETNQRTSDDLLPEIMLAINTAVSETTQHSPAFLVQGQERTAHIRDIKICHGTDNPEEGE